MLYTTLYFVCWFGLTAFCITVTFACLRTCASGEQMSLKIQPVKEITILGKLAAPVMVTQLLQMSTMVADTIMAGRANATELAGVAIGSSIWMPMFLLLIGTLGALTPTVAHLVGANRYNDIPNQVNQSFYKMLLMLPFALLVGLAIEPLFRLIGVDEKIMPIGSGYFYAMLAGLPAVLGFNILRYYSDGMGITRPAMYATVLTVAINVPLNYVFIYGKFGIPAMGGIGCGWASAIAQWLTLLFILYWVKIRPGYAKANLFRQFYRPVWQDVFMLYRVGLPIGASYLIEASVFAIIALFLSPYGPVIVSSHQIALNFSSLLFMVPLSLGLTLTIRVGQLAGAGSFVAARQVGILGAWLAAGIGILAATVLVLFREQIVLLYNDQPPVVSLTSQILLLAAIFQIADALQVALAGTLRGYKDTKIPMYLVVVAFWVVGLPVGYYLGIVGPDGEPWLAFGFWTGLLAGLSMNAVLLFVRFHKISGKYIKDSNPS